MSSLAAAASAYGKRQLELAGPVEADGEGQDHRALVVAGGDLVGDSPGFGQVGRLAGWPPVWPRASSSINRASRGGVGGLAFRSSFKTAIAAARFDPLQVDLGQGVIGAPRSGDWP